MNMGTRCLIGFCRRGLKCSRLAAFSIKFLYLDTVVRACVWLCNIHIPVSYLKLLWYLSCTRQSVWDHQGVCEICLCVSFPCAVSSIFAVLLLTVIAFWYNTVPISCICLNFCWFYAYKFWCIASISAIALPIRGSSFRIIMIPLKTPTLEV